MTSRKQFIYWSLFLTPVCILTSSWLLVHIFLLLGLPAGLLIGHFNEEDRDSMPFAWALTLSLIVSVFVYFAILEPYGLVKYLPL